DNTEFINLDKNFHLYGFGDILVNQNFKDSLTSLYDKSTSSSLTYKEKKELNKYEKKMARKGVALGISDLIVLSPEFQQWHHRKGFDPVKSEKGNIDIAETYRLS